MVCFRYVILNTLHKGNNKDDDNNDDDNNKSKSNICSSKGHILQKIWRQGHMDIYVIHNKPIFNMWNYMQEKAQTFGMHRAVCEADSNLTVLNLNLNDLPENALPANDLKTKQTKWASKSLLTVSNTHFLILFQCSSIFHCNEFCSIISCTSCHCSYNFSTSHLGFPFWKWMIFFNVL